MSARTWFGTRGFETWIPTPAVSPDYSRTGWSSGEAQGLQGGSFLRESKSAHNSYNLTWGKTKKRDEVRIITDFADGVFDSQDGVNLIHWIDPVAADKNVLSQTWGTPALASEDGYSLITDVKGRGRPVAVATPPNGLRYPARSAQYTMFPGATTREHYLPIPPGYSAWVGIHGDSAAQNRIEVQPVNGYTPVGSAVKPTALGLVSTRVNTEFSSLASGGIVLRFPPVTTNATFTLYGLIVQILPIGQAPLDGGFISGQGHAGCQFVGKPAKTPYSAKLDMVALTARLVETVVL